MAEASYSTSDRVLAAAAHAGVFFPGGGVAVPAIIWGLQHNKSKYAGEQSLQAMAYQTFYTVAYVLITLVVLIIAVILVGILLPSARARGLDQMGTWQFAIIPILLLALMGIFTLVGLVGVIATLMGRDFRYPLVGKWVFDYLTRDASTDAAWTHSERLMSGLCHLAVMAPFWGLFAPLMIYLVDEKSRLEFRRDLLQSSVFQAIQAVFSFLMTGVAMVLNFVLGLVALQFIRANPADSGAMLLGAFALLLFLFFILIVLLVVAIFQMLGIVAAYKIWRGQPYRYPVVGGWLDRRNQRPLETAGIHSAE